MKICKWAGDKSDEYCKSCDGIKMLVEGNEVPCDECAGYEEGDKEANVEVKSKDKPKHSEKRADSADNAVSDKKTTNNTPKEEKPVKSENTKPKKVSEEKKQQEVVEQPTGRVKSLRYLSSLTVKKGDNYYKFAAEEEWAIFENDDVDEIREQLWAQLNSEVDGQLEELKNMNNEK